VGAVWPPAILKPDDEFDGARRHGALAAHPGGRRLDGAQLRQRRAEPAVSTRTPCRRLRKRLVPGGAAASARHLPSCLAGGLDHGRLHAVVPGHPGRRDPAVRPSRGDWTRRVAGVVDGTEPLVRALAAPEEGARFRPGLEGGARPLLARDLSCIANQHHPFPPRRLFHGRRRARRVAFLAPTLAMRRPLNFASGPAMLPGEVLQQAREEMLDWRGSGVSVLEMPFTSPEYQTIAAEAAADLGQLLALPDRHRI